MAGLAAAYRLQQAGFEVHVLEAEGHVGGRAHANRHDGWTLNTGATLLSSSYEHMIALCKELGLEDNLVKVNPTVGIATGGEVHWLRGAGPGAAIDFIRTPLLSAKSKLLLTRMIWDTLKARKKAGYDRPDLRAELDTENLAEYCDRRLNREILDNLLGPLMGALFVVDPEEVSVADLYFSLVKFLGGGMLGYRDGIDFLAPELAKRVDVQLEAKVTLLEDRGDGARVVWTQDGTEHDEVVDGAISTLTANHVPGIYPGLDPDIQAILLEGIRPANFIGFRFALSERPDNDGLIVAVAKDDFGGLGTVVLEHNVCPEAAPPGKGVIGCLTYHDWGTARLDRSNEELISELLPELDRIIPGTSDLVEFCEITRWTPGSLHNAKGLHKLIAEVDRRMDVDTRVQLAGDFMTVPSVNGSIYSGERAAGRLSSSIRRVATAAGPVANAPPARHSA
jgi:oxygen-dependent protoporphyrinogen oxidase